MMTIYSSKLKAACTERQGVAWWFAFSAFPSLLSLLAVMAMLMLAGCGNVSHGVFKDGTGASQLVWPSPDSVTPMHKGGTFPEPMQLQLIRYGMNKQQIASLIGYPHFNEGVWDVREWNYLFNFREEGSDRVDVCQFKVLFDHDMTARQYLWHPEACSRYMSVPVSAKAAKAPEQRMVLSADALFAFNKASVGDITNDGRGLLDQLASQLVAEREHIKDIHIDGYADRIGTDVYDASLSERRAYTVMAYLVQQGVPKDLFEVEGRGKNDPVKECPDMSRDALIACLAPNRRVEVRVHTLAQ